MNARQTHLFHRTIAAKRSLSAAFCAAGCGPRCCEQMETAARSAAPLRPADSSIPAEEADLECVIAALESEAVRRALSGVSVPVFHQGRECGSTVKHSDQLLMFLLKTLKPGRYASGKGSGPCAPETPGKTFALEIDLSAAGDGREEGDADTW